MDGLEREWNGRAKVLRLDVYSALGQAAGSRYGVRAIPTFILFDGQGNAVHREVGRLNSDKMKELVNRQERK